MSEEELIMGQYHKAVCLDTREFIHPHKLGDGLKLGEQIGGGPGGVGSALIVLLGVSNGRGGGDLFDPHRIVGRWGGKRVVVIGDYARPGDYVRMAGDPSPEDLFSLCSECSDGGFVDISRLVAETLAPEIGIVYVGNGWRHRVNVWEQVDGLGFTHELCGERVADIRGKTYGMRAIVAAVEQLGDAAYGQKLTVEMLGIKPIEGKR